MRFTAFGAPSVPIDSSMAWAASSSIAHGSSCWSNPASQPIAPISARSSGVWPKLGPRHHHLDRRSVASRRRHGGRRGGGAVDVVLGAVVVVVGAASR